MSNPALKLQQQAVHVLQQLELNGKFATVPDKMSANLQREVDKLVSIKLYKLRPSILKLRSDILPFLCETEKAFLSKIRYCRRTGLVCIMDIVKHLSDNTTQTPEMLLKSLPDWLRCQFINVRFSLTRPKMLCEAYPFGVNPKDKACTLEQARQALLLLPGARARAYREKLVTEQATNPMYWDIYRSWLDFLPYYENGIKLFKNLYRVSGWINYDFTRITKPQVKLSSKTNSVVSEQVSAASAKKAAVGRKQYQENNLPSTSSSTNRSAKTKKQQRGASAMQANNPSTKKARTMFDDAEGNAKTPIVID